MRKKLFAILMSAMMVITFMPTMAFAAVTPTVSSITVTPATLTLVEGKTGDLTATVQANDDYTLLWSIETGNDKVSITNETTNTCTVTAIAEGNAQIKVTATATGGESSKSATVNVKVDKAIPAIDFMLTDTTYELDVNETAEVKVVLVPANTTDEVVYTDGDPSIATVEDGVITAKKKGSTTWKATVKEKTIPFTVTVSNPPTGVKFTDSILYKKSDDIVTLSPVVSYKDTDKDAEKDSVTLEYTSSNEDNITVNNNGQLTFNSIPDDKTVSSDITVKIKGTNYSDKCTVFVSKNRKAAEKVEVVPAKLVLSAGSKYQLSAIVTPSDTTDSIIWKATGNTEISVNETGVVTVSADATVGSTATITATAGDKSDKCEVEIKDVEGVKLNKNELSLSVGQAEKLTATITPEGTTGNLTWASLNPSIATVDQEGNVKALAKGEATITVKLGNTGIGDVCVVTVTDTYNLDDAVVVLDNTTYTYDGTAHEPKVSSVTVKGAVVPSSSYTYTYTNQINAGTTTVKPTVTIAPKTGDTTCTGKKEVYYTINPLSLADSKVTVEAKDKVFTGSAITLTTSDLTVKYDGKTLTDLTGITIGGYDNNTNAAKKDAATNKPKATLTGSGNFSNNKDVNFTIDQMDISDAAVTATVSPQQFTGSAITLTGSDITVSYNGNTLVAGTDFEIDPNGYKNNIDVADKTATNAPEATLTGKGNYKGTKTVNFTITTTLDISDCYIELTYTKMAYTGKARTQTIVVYDEADMPLVKGVDYSVSYKNNTKIGDATVIVTGLGKYAGSTNSEQFQIVPKKVTIKTPSVGSRSVTAKWTKLSSTSATGYQVWVSTSSSFGSGTKKISFKGYSTTKKVVKSLKKGKRYYVKVRAYKTVNGEKYWGLWSSVKKTAKVK